MKFNFYLCEMNSCCWAADVVRFIDYIGSPFMGQFMSLKLTSCAFLLYKHAYIEEAYISMLFLSAAKSMRIGNHAYRNCRVLYK
jgi:hypothetical protein